MIGHSLIIIREYSSHCRDLLLGIHWHDMINRDHIVIQYIPCPQGSVLGSIALGTIFLDEYQERWNTPKY